MTNNHRYNYAQYDFLPILEPDPPWVRIPAQNDQFLQKNFLPMAKNLKCHYCGDRIERSSIGHRDWPMRFQEILQKWNVTCDPCETDLYRCHSCGWWVVLQDKLGNMTDEEKNYRSLIGLDSFEWAKLKEFDLSNLDLPLGYLKDELSKLCQPLFQPSSKKLIKTIHSIFGTFYPCEVIPVGGLDGGDIDTFLVNAQLPVMVRIDQQTKDEAECVQVIQELLGVRRYKGQGAELHISATKRVPEDVIMDLGFTISLTNEDAIYEIIKKTNNEPYHPWDEIWANKE